MTINAFIESLGKPELYAKGSHVMWTDPHVAEQLQTVHLDPEQDLASRKPDSIRRTLEWVASLAGPAALDILELGCGPGLYTQELARSGHRVTGLDFSSRSLQTARQRAEAEGLSIRYVRGDYLKDSLETESYDIIMIVYTDFGVLSPEDQRIFLASVRRALKPGGLFLFDVLYPQDMEGKMGNRHWEAADRGFWAPEPYVALSESVPYLESRAFLNQTLVWIGEELRTYRFWVRFYDEADLERLLTESGLMPVTFRRDILGEDGIWNGDNVLFCAAKKPREPVRLT